MNVRTQPILDDPPLLPPVLAAIGGGLVSALAGALLVGGTVLIGWWGAVTVPIPAMLATIGKVWLLAHGGVLNEAGLRITLIPLGLAAVFVLVCAASAAFAYQQAARARPRPVQGRARLRMLVLVAVELAGGYLIGAVVIALLAGAPVTSALAGAAVVGFVGGLVGAWWRSGHPVPLPAWGRAAGAGAVVGVAALVALSAITFGVALVQGEPRMVVLEQELGFDASGSVVWALIGLMYLPNLLGWVASWLLGVGFGLGDGSLVAPWATQLGMLPSIPVFGALPADGTDGLEGWLAVGVVAGLLAGVAAVTMAARYRTVPTDPVAALLSGALAGFVAGLGYLAWAALSRGALGVDRFAVVGPRFPEALIGVGTLTVAAALGAVATWGVLVRRTQPTSTP